MIIHAGTAGVAENTVYRTLSDANLNVLEALDGLKWRGQLLTERTGSTTAYRRDVCLARSRVRHPRVLC